MPQQQAACTENLKFGHLVSDIFKWTDIRTDMLVTILCTPT